jgi:hypothetical protein
MNLFGSEHATLPICDLRWRGDSDRVFRPCLVNLPRLIHDWCYLSCVETEEEDRPYFLLSERRTTRSESRCRLPSLAPSLSTLEIQQLWQHHPAQCHSPTSVVNALRVASPLCSLMRTHVPRLPHSSDRPRAFILAQNHQQIEVRLSLSEGRGCNT